MVTDPIQFDFSDVFTLALRSSILGLMVAEGRHVKISGRGPGSLEDEATAGLDYLVMNGNDIERACDWYGDLRASVMERVLKLLGRPVVFDPNPASAVNINCLSSGKRYELHTDSNPLTLVVFVNDTFTGGMLRIKVEEIWEVIQPVAGCGVLFEGFRQAHVVERVHSGVRCTMLFSLYPDGWEVEGFEGRPAETDAYLYEGRQ